MSDEMSHSVPFFTRSLSAFLSSPDPFRILATCTPWPSHAHSPSAEPAAPRTPRHGIKTLIVLDSSFNPPTRAHAQMARSALRAAGPGARLLLLLAVHNADKGSAAMTGLASRLGMMEAFGRDLLGHEAAGAQCGHGHGHGHGEAIEEVDVAVTKMPFFGDKAASIAEAGSYVGPGGEGHPEQVYLCGFDTLVRILDAKYYGGGGGNGVSGAAAATPMQKALRPFFAMAKLRVTMRPDDAWGSRDEQRAYVVGLAQADGQLERLGGDADWARRLELVDGVGGVVSSSRVREMVRRGVGGDELDGLVGPGVRRCIDGEGLYRA
ncbi:hypothetical protein E4U43_006523 [Claviceps pusilla]|uniref:Nicotinamide-nucleotide adenylyltransferase n=1 Tax=Claviceps pusilla TaxID=123648 RepID=A0A9P7N3Q0_9HYPO|nr:hypothetical protein E4U43_006523 [Claviceps pusilla]